MEFRVLGPLEVVTAGGAVPLTGPKRRALLARFLVSAGETISAAALADDLWSGSPPRSATTTLQTFVYQLRRRYGIEVLRTTPAGYVLDVADEQVDALSFEAQTRAAIVVAGANPRSAHQALQDALDLWRGPAYVEFSSAPWAIAESARLDQLRIDAIEVWAACAIGANMLAGLATELEAWTTREPLRESLWALRLLALSHDGRTAEALRVATKLREILREELGVDPSAPFTAIENAILREDAVPAWPELGGFGLTAGPVPVAAVDAQAAPAARPSRSRRPASHLRSIPAAGTPASEVFVGRVSELTTLERALESASNGLPQIVVLSGESGIGKSRLLDEFTPHAVSRGVQVLAGACQEDVAVPYLPLASALAALDSGVNPFESSASAGKAGTDDDRARLALYLATTRSLLGAARERVTTLVVEDLHWADDATLSLLKHLLAVVVEQGVIERARLLVVLTTRPPAPSTAVATLVARLQRERQTIAIDLRALTERECRDLIANWLGERPSRATIGRLFEATAGNPLVLRSALGRVGRRGAPITESTLVDLVGPTDLDRELWRRFEQVGDACSEMLVSAAFLGDGATLEFLGAACGRDPVALDDLIEEAGAHQVLVADDERYWFEHPQLRQLVYHWPASAERAGRHLQLADRLDPARADVRVIAHHLVRAGSVVEPARMLAVCGEAADRSAAVGAWHDAAAYASAAFLAAERLDLPDAALAAIRLRAGHTALLARDTASALAHLEAAVEQARACGAVEVWGRALVHLARERVGTIELRAAATLSLASLDEFLDLGVGDAALRGEAHALAGELHFDLGDLAEAERHNCVAADIALEANDDELHVKVAFARGLQHLGSIELAEARDRFAAAAPIAARLTDSSPHIWCTSRLGLVAYTMGNLEQADSLLAEAGDASRDVENTRELSMAAAFQAAIAAVRGRFAGAETHAERALTAHRELPTPFSPGVAYPALASARMHRGDAEGARAALDLWDALNADRGRRYRPLVDAFVGDLSAARRALERPTFRVFTTITGPNAFLTGAIAAQVELGALAGHPDLVRGPLGTLMELYDRGLRFGIGWPAFIPRVVALGLAATERENDARVWFDRALVDARAASATAELARTALDYARVLEDGPGANSADAAELRVIASEARATISDSRARIGPAPSRVAERRSGDDLGRRHPSTRVILVTDLVESTALNDRLGDRGYVGHLRVHDEIIRRRLAEYDGVEFKNTGDGIGAWFFSVSAALRCAAALARDFAAVESGPMRVRIALSAGEPTMVERDLIGLAVTVAFRILELGRPGEVLVTSDVAGIARGLDWEFEPHGRHDLKGLHAPVEVLRSISGERAASV